MHSDVIIIGAGAAGLMCAISAAEQGKQVTVLDHANKAGKKILISGGGRCNFTNLHTDPSNFLSSNPHFCKSALNRYTQWDFIAELDKACIPWHEKKLGQLFSDNKSQAILNFLLDRCEQLGVVILLNYTVLTIQQDQQKNFVLAGNASSYTAQALVIATGAMSFPTMGATDFGHKIARQFGLKVTNTTPALVPLTFDKTQKDRFDGLAGIAIDSVIECHNQSFHENLLFTHKGISGPAVLQISSYWRPGHKLTVTCLPDINLHEELMQKQTELPSKQLNNILQQFFPARMIDGFCKNIDLQKPIQNFKHAQLKQIADLFQNWQFIPSGTEGYKKAEVTLGGIDTDEISSKTFEAKKVNKLYFIGEVLDVTGQLGGFNFQWAWASGYCCGRAL